MNMYGAIKDRWGRLSQTGKHICIGFELFNDWNLVVSVSNHWTIPLKSLTQKQLYFQGSRLARIYSHTEQHCLPVLKSLTWASTLQVRANGDCRSFARTSFPHSCMIDTHCTAVLHVPLKVMWLMDKLPTVCTALFPAKTFRVLLAY